jgi:hypothetical protein
MRLHRYGVGVMAWAALHAQANRLVAYNDPTYGVSFVYPSEWKQDPQLGWYLGTDILHAFATKFDPLQPIAKIGFQNTGVSRYAGTNLDGVEFVYAVVPHLSEHVCYARLEEFLSNTAANRKPVVIHGMTYLHFATGDGGLGHAATRDVYAAHVGDRCYLFEAGIHSEPGSDQRPVTKAQSDALRAQLRAVMESVQVHVRPGI